MACDCAGTCPKSAQCIAIYIHDTGECWVLCSKDAIVLAADEARKVALDQKIDVDMRGIELAQLGEFLSARAEVDLLIPARNTTDWVDIKAKDITLGDLIEQSGLVIAAAGAAAD